jgi:hypothetical protein
LDLDLFAKTYLLKNTFKETEQIPAAQRSIKLDVCINNSKMQKFTLRDSLPRLIGRSADDFKGFFKVKPESLQGITYINNVQKPGLEQ